MNIKDFARKPQLVEVTIDDEDIVTAYGEAITFYMMDFVKITTYFDFFRSQSENDGDRLNDILRKIILNAQGEPALKDDEILPIDICIAALTRINQTLGKSKTKS
jgi:hypothetical protein